MIHLQPLFIRLVLAANFVFASSIPAAELPQKITNLKFRISESFPHDPNLFTQGLLLHKGVLYESAGRYGHSKLISRTFDNTTPLREYALSKNRFAEGIAVLHNNLYQLSWRSGEGWIYNLDTLHPEGDFNYEGEGWGLTTDGNQLIMSDGSHVLSFRSPEHFKETQRLPVTVNNQPLDKLNELEWINGLIAANIWGSNEIVFINPDNGQVVSRLDLTPLVKQQAIHIGVLNGIAYDPRKQRLYVTGKNWPRLYELIITPLPTRN